MFVSSYVGPVCTGRGTLPISSLTKILGKVAAVCTTHEVQTRTWTASIAVLQVSNACCQIYKLLHILMCIVVILLMFYSTLSLECHWFCFHVYNFRDNAQAKYLTMWYEAYKQSLDNRMLERMVCMQFTVTDVICCKVDIWTFIHVFFFF